VTDLRRLQYFLAVARERNFTRAAEQLHIAQPALSRQVRLLEDELGVELLHRTTHAFELTEAGAFLLQRGPALLAGPTSCGAACAPTGAGIAGAWSSPYGASASYETAPKRCHNRQGYVVP
jgi:DNA-binding transcriptional LysR family regulator